MTLPIPIVVTSFAACYKNRLWRNEITMKKRMVTSYNQKDHKLAEKRNLFPDLAGPGGFYIQKKDNNDDDEDTSLLSLSAITPTSTVVTNGDLFSQDEGQTPLQTEDNCYQISSTTETSFLVEGTVEEKMCLVQQTDV